MAFVGSAYIKVVANTSQFDNGVQRAIKRLEDRYGAAGATMGNLFGKKTKASFQDLDREAVSVYESFNGLIEKSYYLQGALAAFAPVLSAVVSGFAALIAQVGAAGPALIAIPSILGAMVQGMLTLKLAFGGIGKALQQMGKNSGDTAKKLKELRDTSLRAKDALIRAEWRHADAVDALNKAYEVASERIQQLNFDAEDAALSQKRAAIALEEARATLKRVQDLPPNNRARKEAELAFQEADLNYRRAVDKNKDLQAEQNKTTNNGQWSAEQQVNNSEEVINAKRNELDASMALTAAEKERKDALDKYNKAKAGGSSDGGASDAASKLTDAQKKFADFINSIKPQLDDLKEAAGEKLFGPLTDAIKNLVTNFKDPLVTMLRDTGGALGEVAVSISKVITEADNLKNFKIVTQQNVETIKDLGKVFGNLYDSVLTLLAAASPLVDRFTDWLVVITDGWKNTLEAKNQTGALTAMFDYAGEVAANLGDIFGNLFGAFINIGRAAAGPGSGGEMIVTSIEDWSQRFEDFTAELLANGKLEDFFKKVSDVFLKVLGMIKDIGKAFLKSGGADETGKTVDSMGSAVDSLISAFEKIVASGPAFANFLGNIAHFIDVVSESESVKLFFGVLSTALEALSKVLSAPGMTQLLAIGAAYHGLRFGVVRTAGVISKTRKYIKGDFLKMADMAGNAKDKFIAFGGALKTAGAAVKNSAAYAKVAAAATKVWSGVQAAFNAVMAANPIVLIAIAIAALIAILVAAYFRFKWFRDFVDSVWDVIAAGLTFLWENVLSPVFSAMGSVFAAVWGGIQTYFSTVWGLIQTAISFAWDNIIQPVFRAFATVFEAVWGGIRTYFETIWSVIYRAVTWAWDNVIRPVFDAIGRVFGNIWSGIRTAFEGVWNFITGAVSGATTIFGGVRDAIVNAFRNAINFIIRAWNRLEFRIPEVKVAGFTFGGFTLGLPDIPELAKGGVIQPSTDGTIARIGEAGRPERVEPLDPDGLSKRDKALIKELTFGGTSGATFNIYPSPGMNEIELASLVNRQIAFQLRKGAA